MKNWSVVLKRQCRDMKERGRLNADSCSDAHQVIRKWLHKSMLAFTQDPVKLNKR